MDTFYESLNQPAEIPKTREEFIAALNDAFLRGKDSKAFAHAKEIKKLESSVELLENVVRKLLEATP